MEPRRYVISTDYGLQIHGEYLLYIDRSELVVPYVFSFMPILCCRKTGNIVAARLDCTAPFYRLTIRGFVMFFQLTSHRKLLYAFQYCIAPRGDSRGLSRDLDDTQLWPWVARSAYNQYP